VAGCPAVALAQFAEKLGLVADPVALPVPVTVAVAVAVDVFV
jgi:hypothetical protein